MFSDLWFEEKFKDFLGLRLKVERVLFSGKSEFQTVDVVETKGHGKVLLNDGLIMVSERDEFAYHEMISHVPLFTHPNPKNVLVIGGGDGGTAREVIRHASVEKCVMVEIDAMVIEASSRHIPQTSSELNNSKIELIIGDGVKFVKECKQKFDIVIVDSTDPIGPAKPLFSPDFYNDVYQCLNDDGIVVSQGESSWYALEIQQSLLAILNDRFSKTYLYNFSNITYPGGLWSFSFASKNLDPITDFEPLRVTNSGLAFDYYNSEIHKGCFALPSFVLKGLRGVIDNN